MTVSMLERKREKKNVAECERVCSKGKETEEERRSERGSDRVSERVCKKRERGSCLSK